MLYATGGAGRRALMRSTRPSLIYQTVAHNELTGSGHDDYGDPAEIAAACINLAIITGNLGRPGGGVARPRGPANYQGVTDMGAHPAGYRRIRCRRTPRRGSDSRPPGCRTGAIAPRPATDSCRFAIADQHRLDPRRLPEAIETGRVKAMMHR